MNTQIIYKEYTILWFEFDMWGLQHQQYATDPTLNNITGRESAFQRQEQVRDDVTGR